MGSGSGTGSATTTFALMPLTGFFAAADPAAPFPSFFPPAASPPAAFGAAAAAALDDSIVVVTSACGLSACEAADRQDILDTCRPRMHSSTRAATGFAFMEDADGQVQAARFIMMACYGAGGYCSCHYRMHLVARRMWHTSQC